MIYFEEISFCFLFSSFPYSSILKIDHLLISKISPATAHLSTTHPSPTYHPPTHPPPPCLLSTHHSTSTPPPHHHQHRHQLWVVKQEHGWRRYRLGWSGKFWHDWKARRPFLFLPSCFCASFGISIHYAYNVYQSDYT